MSIHKTFLSVVLFVGIIASAGCSSSETNSTTGPTGGTGSCKAICTQMAAPKCANTDPDCESGCTSEQTPACATKKTAYLNCASTATYTCDSEGEPTSSSCQAQFGEYIACLLSNHDAGTD